MSDAVHILPGFCAEAARETVGAQRVFEIGDQLSCGPLQPMVDLSAWQATREAFWRNTTGWDFPGACELVGDTEELVRARRIVIWLDASLDDQLALAYLPALLEAVGASPEQIDLIQFPMGANLLHSHAAPPPPVRLSQQDLDELRRAWSALVAPEPDALIAAAGSDYEPLPHFTRALRALLLRYPEKISGVNATELRLLEESRGGTKAARIIGNVLGELSAGVDHCGDDWLFRRLLRLGAPSLAHPPIDLTGSTSAYRFVSARLTPFGERVLAGEANFVDANGIDDWVAGVHLQSEAGRVWFYDEGRLIRRP
jgi:hypothetical protein